MIFPHAPGTTYRRALRRVERRSLAIQAWVAAHPELRGFDQHTDEYALLVQACRTANSLAIRAGLAGPLRIR